VGIPLVLASAVRMPGLDLVKMRPARRLGFHALRAEAVESPVRDLQDLTVLVGLGAKALWD